MKNPELIARTLTNGRTVMQVLGGWYRADPEESLLWRAAELYTGCSPSMVQGAARWLGVLDDLEEGGLTPLERAQVLASTIAGEPEGWVPDGHVLALAFADGSEVDVDVVAGWASTLAEAGDDRAIAKKLLTVAMALEVRSGRGIRAEWEDWICFHVPWDLLRDVVVAVPDERRDDVIAQLIGRPSHDNGARVQLRYLLPLLDLVQGPKSTASYQRIRDLLEGKEQWKHLLDSADAGGGPPPDGISDEVRAAVEYWLRKYEKARRAHSIGAFAQAVHGRELAVSAPELTNWQAWNGASDERRQAVAAAVAECAGGVLIAIEDVEAGPIGVVELGGQRWRIVPGGTYVRGFSQHEEQVVRDAAAIAPQDNHYEQYDHLLDEMSPWMRPVGEVTVTPLLVAEQAFVRCHPSEVGAHLEQGSYRLPSEAEWEYLARGCRSSELTWLADEIPDEDAFHRMHEASNSFGLRQMGLWPEVCADGWVGHYTDAPTDGSPRWVDGPRVVRGGAANLYPWQEVGEWQLLMNAMRSSDRSWEYELAIRPVLGIR